MINKRIRPRAAKPIKRQRPKKVIDWSLIKESINIRPVNTYGGAELEALIELCERSYRAGFPIMDDDVFDFIYVKEFKKRYPNHKYFDTVGSDL